MQDIVIKIQGTRTTLRIPKTGNVSVVLSEFFDQDISKDDYEYIFRTNVSVLYNTKRSDFKRRYKTYGDLYGKDAYLQKTRNVYVFGHLKF